jgi:hypothetical protein
MAISRVLLISRATHCDMQKLSAVKVHRVASKTWFMIRSRTRVVKRHPEGDW